VTVPVSKSCPGCRDEDLTGWGSPRLAPAGSESERGETAVTMTVESFAAELQDQSDLVSVVGEWFEPLVRAIPNAQGVFVKPAWGGIQFIPNDPQDLQTQDPPAVLLSVGAELDALGYLPAVRGGPVPVAVPTAKGATSGTLRILDSSRAVVGEASVSVEPVGSISFATALVTTDQLNTATPTAVLTLFEGQSGRTAEVKVPIQLIEG
jgi:hypothetical protein